MDLSSNLNGEMASQEPTSPVDADANGSQIVSTDNNPREEKSTVADVKLADTVLAEKSSPGLGDLGDASFVTVVPVIQNLADVVEVMSVVANESEPELQPSDADHSKVGTETDASAQQNDQVMVEAIEGGAETTEPGNMQADSYMKQGATTASVEGSTDQGNTNMAGVDVESFLSGGDEKLELEEHGGENEPETEGADYISVDEHLALPISERRKHKRLEVFVGGLDKETTEEDLSSVFKKVGDVMEVRLMKNSQTGKNKGYAFIRFASAALAKKAASEMERVQIRGRSCGVLPSEENDTLFLGNISKSWKKETVLDALKKFGIENVEDITLMEDPQLEGVNRGFAFVEFNTHKEALSAFRRLQQSDAIFGTDRSAKVAWAQPLNEPDEDTMSQVKSVFVDGMPPSWDEEKVKEHFSKYGTIERIVLARNMLSAKRKDFGFVNYINRDSALSCIEALNNSEINDGDIKMKVKVMLAKPQTKNKPIKGSTHGGYLSGFRGDHRVGMGIEGGMGVGGMEGGGRMGMGGLGMGMGMGMGVGIPRGMELIPYDGWGNIPRFDNQLRFGGLHDPKFGMSNSQRPEKKLKRGGKQNNEELYVKTPSLQTIKDKTTTINAEKKEKKPDGTKLVQDPPQNGDYIPLNSCDVENNEQPISHVPNVIASKPSLDKFECTMCGFGFDSFDEYELHKQTKLHKVIGGLRKDQKLNNKTPLSLLHEYASKHHCEVHYETNAETNGPFEVTAVIGGSIGASGTPKKGFGVGRNKARAKQMAAANALEKIMETVPEVEFIKPGQSKQRFGDRERSNRKGKGGNSGGGGGGSTSVGGGANRHSLGRPNPNWPGLNNNSSFLGLPNMGGGGNRGGSGKNKRYNNTNDMFFRNGNNTNFISNPNAIPLSGYNEFSRAVAQRGLGERYGGRAGALNPSFQGARGIIAQNSETYAERYDRIQGGRGYGNPGIGGRDFIGGVGNGSENFNGCELPENAFANKNLPPPPPLLNFNTRDLSQIGFASANRDYDASGMKRPFLQMDEDSRFADAQRTLPRQRLEAPEQISMQPNTTIQTFGVQPMYSEAQRSSIARPQEQPQYNTYIQPQSQGLHVGHNIVQSPHISTQHGNMSVAMVGVPSLPTPQGGTPYSIYDAAPQTNPSLSSNGYANANQDYMINASSISEISQGNSYPTQNTYNVPYGIMQSTIPSQVVGGFTPIQNSIQQQSFY